VARKDAKNAKKTLGEADRGKTAPGLDPASAGGGGENEQRAMNTFQFYRFRFQFRAMDAVRFPRGKSANTLRGAFGLALRKVSPEAYARLFEWGGAAETGHPSGLADLPRPFVFRARALDGLEYGPGERFGFDVHVFEVREPLLDVFRVALMEAGAAGLGPGRGRADLERIEEIDLEDRATITGDVQGAPLEIGLDAEGPAVTSMTVRFETPTELKADGRLVDRPEFGVLFGRVRDRLSTLRALYGEGPLDVDFKGMGERAEAVKLARCRLEWERIDRRSGRTGQVHPIGGFTGEAEYQGALGEFVPWVRAARWAGVGRQTVWGKGEVRVVETA
jgi:hypothetical protein